MKKMLMQGIDNFDFIQIVRGLQNLGVTCQRLPHSDIIQASYHGHTEFLVDHELPNIPLGYKNILEDKFFLKQLLLDQGIPALKGDVFHDSAMDFALDYATHTLGWPVVVKPTNLSCGDEVFCAIQNEQAFLDIWQNSILKTKQPYYIIEACWTYCPDYRFMLFRTADPAVAKRTVPTVVGDGIHNLEQLVAIENKRRISPCRNCLCDIVLFDDDGLRCIEDQNLSLSYVPEKNARVKLRYTSNLSYGGMAEIIDNHLVHPTYWDMLDSIWALFPELPFLSVDVFSKDISLPVSAEHTAVNESHITPSIGLFLAPAIGKPIDVLTPIVCQLFPEVKL